MRTYGQHPTQHGGQRRATGHQRSEVYANREATEWDVRLDVNDILTADVIVNNIKERLNELQYVLVSGVERPDKDVSPNQGIEWKPIPSGSTELHVHVCVVLHKALKRGDVLHLLRGSRKLGDEYCAPRNEKFTYAGWVIHHGKPGFKIDGEPLIRFEWGTLPMDAFTPTMATKIKGILKKWSTPEMATRFKAYTDIANDPKEEMRKQIDRKQALIEKLQEEIFSLRVQLE